MEAGKDIHLTGATLEALGDNGSLILKAGNNIHLDTGYSRSQARHDREQRQLHPFSKANKLYGQVEWIELYFEIAVYNSQYQIDSVHRGECYE